MLVGFASRTQKLNSEPSAHWQSPPGTIRSHAAATSLVVVAVPELVRKAAAMRAARLVGLLQLLVVDVGARAEEEVAVGADSAAAASSWSGDRGVDAR